MPTISTHYLARQSARAFAPRLVLCRLTALWLLLLGGAAPVCAGPVTLVDVNFDSAPVGTRPPVLDGPPSQPNDRLVGFNFGEAVVADNVPGMNRPIQLQPRPFSPDSSFIYSQPLVFSSFVTPTSGRTFLFEMDFRVSNFQPASSPRSFGHVDSLTVLFDVPYVQRLDFISDGFLGRVHFGLTAQPIGATFTLDGVHHMAVFLDMDTRKWAGTLDGSLIFTNAVFEMDDQTAHLSSLRINLTDSQHLPGVPEAFIDNLRLTEFPVAVPEPGLLPLLGVVGGVCLALRRQRRGVE